MYPAQPDSPDFTLAADITTTGQTALVFVSLVGLLAAPNTLTIRQDDSDTTPETMYYAVDPVGTTLTVTRGYGGTVAKTFVAGALACRAHTALDHNTIRANILDLASTKQDSIKVGTATNVQDGVVVTYSPGALPRALILVPICTGSESDMLFMQFVSLQSFTASQFIANIKTNSGSPGNPMTITWIAVM